nr:HAD family hydrolase [Candidatus Njordarchaeota archaeon]
MRVKAVLFDLFDTLLLLEKHEAYYAPSLKKLHEFLSNNGIDVSFENFKQVYFEVRDKFYSESRESLEEPHFNLRISQTLQRLGYNFDASDPLVVGSTEAFSDEFMRYVSLDEDALDVLQKLYGKYKLGMISNFAIPECCWKLLEKFDLNKFFDVVLISGEINRRKPSAEVFEKALKTLGVKASNAVFVGDMLDLDVAGPKSVEMKTIFIKRRPMEENADVIPDKVISRLSELLVVLEDC